MSLDLDARQRAMLAEMGITVWQPAAPAAEPSHAPMHTTATASSAAPAAAPVPAAPARPQAGAVAAPVAVPPAPPGAAPARGPSPAVPAAGSANPAPPVPGNRPSEASAAPALRLHAPLPLYPQADPAATPVELGSGWLVVAESAAPEAPLTGDAGKLLDNMLRAMRLHRHPRTHFAAVERAAPGASADAQEAAEALQGAIATLRPAMVLVLGLSAARAVLGSREPLGRLRATVHRLPDGTPAVVTYDPAYLLRAPDAKAAAWADLCRALGQVRNAAAGTVPPAAPQAAGDA
ncbi:uracil-DNA glycosylase family protein [Acidovorax sp. PRC11]|uniref:uracil-DNA glycosylase family protein n=1 Tax=Acidovorax sp. PRC11 TaxID=2962592 RepID=UPI002881C66D|nr:uracil-DNA glycosylase family protein [Acidovorax sp. PRC11]MDT0136871.1 uracil-DNA glycosylase family protein [Acidovorax sp. PRC11]